MHVRDAQRTPAVLKFVEAARDFIKAIDEPHASSVGLFLQKIVIPMIHAYEHAQALPEIDLIYNNRPSRSITFEEYVAVIQQLNSTLQEYVAYWEVFDPTDMQDNEPVAGSLADDLSDIYRDLKHSMIHYDSGREEAMEHALWEWRFSFETHWGSHVVNGLRAIHFILYSPHFKA